MVVNCFDFVYYGLDGSGGVETSELIDNRLVFINQKITVVDAKSLYLFPGSFHPAPDSA